MRIFSLYLQKNFFTMPRKIRPRKVVEPPKFRSYTPQGGTNDKGEPVLLHYEEYEALKLADYDNMNHCEAAKLMDISRPTFARIYESARKKIAKAFVERCEIQTIYGNAHIERNWYECNNCNTRYTITRSIENIICPVCKSKNTKELFQ